MSALTGGQVSEPVGSVKIEARKENLLSNGTAGAGGLGAGQPLPSRRAGDAGNPWGRSWLELIPLGLCAKRDQLGAGSQSCQGPGGHGTSGRLAPLPAQGSP